MAEELRSLETEGAMYADFADHQPDSDGKTTFTRYRVAFTPAEIYGYVEALLAEQEFIAAFDKTGDFTASVLAIRDEKYRTRIAEYGNYGKSRTKDGQEWDIRGCTASFLGEDLEALVCGLKPDRYVAMPSLGPQSNQDELILTALKSVAVSARRLRSRAHGRASFTVENEYDVQDLAETALRSIYADVVREEWTPKRAGNAKRIDLAIPSASVVVECKYAHKANAKHIADELRVDFECYHDYSECRRLFAVVYDPENRIEDPESFSRDLSGLRRKQEHEFFVTVVVI